MRRFFDRPPDEVAYDLVGTVLVLRDRDQVVHALVVETEAYGGVDDPASHAFRGPTKRSAVMFGAPGVLYVYRIYGLHWCMNVVTEAVETASAVLLRAAELYRSPAEVAGVENESVLLRGPGNLTRGLGVTGDDNAMDCCLEPRSRITFCEGTVREVQNRIGQTPRIGISKGRDRLSRYFLDGHPAVSRVPGFRS